MSEPRKNHLNIDGGQVKEEGHVDSYKPLPEADTEFKPKPALSKSKEKISDEAEEKLLQKENRPRITSNDMAEAKYVVGDQRNGDTKVHIVADGKRQFSGLTQEELKKYADDPFWVRLRWFMFILFWAGWLCMLGGAIAIIVRAPKCDAPPVKTWAEFGPLADRGIDTVDYSALEAELPSLAAAKVQGLFINPCEETYQVLDSNTCLDKFKSFLGKAKEQGIKLIVDLTANFVPKDHIWFRRSENKTEGFTDYFIWGKKNEHDADNRPLKPNNWISILDEPAWTWSDKRQEYYLNQFGADKPDLNFHNPAVVAHFDEVLAKWMKAGASGVRLVNARHLVVDKSKEDEKLVMAGPGPDHASYGSLIHIRTVDQPELKPLLTHFAHIAKTNGTEDSIFTMYENGKLTPEWFRLNSNLSILRPPFASPILVEEPIDKVAKTINKAVVGWPALKLRASAGEYPSEIAAYAMLLPAAPVLTAEQLPMEDNNTIASSRFAVLSELRSDPSVQHGHHVVAAVPAAGGAAGAGGGMLACARWKAGHTGFAAVYNPSDVQSAANLTALQSVPESLTVHYMSQAARASVTNFTTIVEAEMVVVPPRSTVVLSYVPKLTVEQ